MFRLDVSLTSRRKDVTSKKDAKKSGQTEAGEFLFQSFTAGFFVERVSKASPF